MKPEDLKIGSPVLAWKDGILADPLYLVIKDVPYSHDGKNWFVLGATGDPIPVECMQPVPDHSVWEFKKLMSFQLDKLAGALRDLVSVYKCTNDAIIPIAEMYGTPFDEEATVGKFRRKDGLKTFLKGVNE